MAPSTKLRRRGAMRERKKSSIISALAEFIVRFIESINLHLRMLQKSDVIYLPPTLLVRLARILLFMGCAGLLWFATIYPVKQAEATPHLILCPFMMIVFDYVGTRRINKCASLAQFSSHLYIKRVKHVGAPRDH